MENNEQTKEPAQATKQENSNENVSWKQKFFNAMLRVGCKFEVTTLIKLALKHDADAYATMFEISNNNSNKTLKVNTETYLKYQQAQLSKLVQTLPQDMQTAESDNDGINMPNVTARKFKEDFFNEVFPALDDYKKGHSSDNRNIAVIYTDGIAGGKLAKKEIKDYKALLQSVQTLNDIFQVDENGQLMVRPQKTEEKTNNASEQNTQNTENADPFLLILGNLWEKGKNGLFGFAVKYRYLGLFKMMLPHVNPHEVYFSTRFGDVEMRANTLTYLAHQWVVSSNQTDNAGKAAHQENAFMFLRSEGQHVNPVGEQPVAQILTHPRNLKRPCVEWTWNTYSDLGKQINSDSLISTVFESEKNFSAFMQLFTPHEERQR